MANHITRLVLDNSDFNSEFGKSAKFVREFFKGIDDLNNGMIGLSGQQKSFLLNLGKTPTSAKNAEVAIEQLKYIMDSLSKSYNKMSDDVRKGDVGTAAARAITDLTNRIAALKAEMATVGTTKRMYVSPSTTVSGGGGDDAASAASAVGSLSKKGAFSAILGGNLAARAVMDSFRLIKNTVKDAIEVNMEFEYSQATLSAVLGVSKDKMLDLTNQARELGSTTLYTANEITGLQVSLARLGFNQTEIEQSTKAVSQLALATGVDLNDAATLTGSTLRAFGYDASEAARVASVLGVSTTKSALDMEKLKISMAYASSVSRQAGFEIEDVVAMLGKMVDNGQQATTAGVNMRNIMLDLSNKSSDLSKAIKQVTGKDQVHNMDEFISALRQMRDAGMNLDDVANVVQKRVTPGFLNMIANTEGIAQLRDELKNCNGELDAMAAKMADTLQGSVTLLKNSWDGLMLSFSSSNGTLKKVVDSMTRFVNGLKKAKETGELKSSLQSLVTVVGSLTAAFVAFKVVSNIKNIIIGIQIAVDTLKIKMQALNTVIKSNPWGLLASAVAAATVAIIGFTKRANDIAEAEREAAEEAKRLREEAEKFKEERIANSVGDVLGEFARLQLEYQNLKDNEINTWIEDNASSFDHLGLKINNAADALKVFETNSLAVMAALQSRAIADAYKDIIDEKSNQVVAAKQKYQKEDTITGMGAYLSGKSSVSDLTSDEYDYLNNAGFINRIRKSNKMGIKYFNELVPGYENALWNYHLSTFEKNVENVQKEFDDLTQEYIKAIKKFQEEAANLGGVVSTTTTTTTSGSITGNKGLHLSDREEAQKEYDEAQKKVANALTDYDIAIRKATLEKEAEYINDEQFTKKKLSAEERLLGSYTDVVASMNYSIDTNKENALLASTLAPLLDEYGIAITTETDAVKLLAQKAAELAKAREEAAEAEREERNKLNEKKSFNKRILRGLESYTRKAGVSFGDVGMTDELQQAALRGDIINWQPIVDNLNKLLAKYHFQIAVDLDSGSIEKLKDQLREGLDNFKTGLGSVQSIVGALDSIKQAGEDLAETFNEGTSAWNAMMSVFNLGFTVLNAVVTVMEAIMTLQELGQALSNKSAASKEAEMVATTSLAAAEGGQAIAAGAQAAANTDAGEASLFAAKALMAEAIASIAAKYALVPGGPLIAAAEIASLTGVYAGGNSAVLAASSILHAAEGGIVPGAYNGGIDTVPAMLSPGEVILNAAQQNNVAAKLQGAGAQHQAVQVYGRVSGKDILLASNNYNRARGGSRSAYTQIK